MAKRITVVPTAGNAFVDLFRTIVGSLPEEVAQEYAWYVVRLYGEGDMPRAVGRTMSDVLETIDQRGALPLSWPELEMMSRTMWQIFDLVVVGVAGGSAKVSPEDNGFDALVNAYGIVIEAFDSSEWRIGGRDERLIASVAASLA